MRIRRPKREQKIRTPDLFLERNVHGALLRRVEKVVQVQEASKKRKRGRPPKNRQDANGSPNVGVQQVIMGLGIHGNRQGIQGDSQGNHGRCRRNDGKRWRCSNLVESNEDYCVRHMLTRMKKAKKNGEYQAPTKPPITNADFQLLPDLSTAFTVPIKHAISNVDFQPLPDLVTPFKTDICVKAEFSQCAESHAMDVEDVSTEMKTRQLLDLNIGLVKNLTSQTIVYSGKATTPANKSINARSTAEKMEDSPVRPPTPARATDAQIPPHLAAGNTATSQPPMEALTGEELASQGEDSGPNRKKPRLALNDDADLGGEKLNGLDVNMIPEVVDKPVAAGNMQEVLTQASSCDNMQLVVCPDPGQVAGELKEFDRLTAEVAEKDKLIEKLCVEDFKRRIEVEEMMKKFKEMESMKREGTAILIEMRDLYMKAREENQALKAEIAALKRG